MDGWMDGWIITALSYGWMDGWIITALSYMFQEIVSMKPLLACLSACLLLEIIIIGMYLHRIPRDNKRY